MTRITQLAMTTNSLANLQASLTKVQKLQEQASSGKRIGLPSDDPQATASSMVLRSAQSANNQYTRNGQYANSRLSTADSALQSISAQLQQVRSLVVRSQSGAMDDNARAAISAQITQIKSEVIDHYNTQYLGRPVFGGTVAGGKAIDDSGTYIGDGTAVMAKLSGSASVRVDVDGASIGADTVPGMLDQVAADVLQTDGTAQADLDAIDDVLSKISIATANVGAAETRVSDTLNLNSSRSVDLTNSIAQNESIDLAEVLTKVAAQQVAYQSALGVTAKINQTSLLDFLR
jgi:flagellar hook-associated protein 3 FlgL